jgi:hypothetical protein
MSISPLTLVKKYVHVINYLFIYAQVDAEQVGPGAILAGFHSLQYPKTATFCLIVMENKEKIVVRTSVIVILSIFFSS